MNLTSVLGNGLPRLCRRELSRYVSHEGESICRGDTPTLIGMDGKRDLMESMLSAHLDDNDDVKTIITNMVH